MKKLKIIPFLLFLNLCLFAQTDNHFWFAAPDISHNHGLNPPTRYGDGRPLYIHINAIQSTTVTISRPADPTFTPISVFLAEGQSKSFNLEDYLGIAQIECHANTVENHGFLIESSPGEINAFYEMNNSFNREIFSLKGGNALGRSFTVTTQNIFSNTTSASYSDAFSGFVVVATENNTTINVQSAQDFFGHSAGLHTIVLNKGETYNFMAASKTAAAHPQGVKVTSDKDIAVTIYDDSMMRTSSAYGNGGGLDTFGDQYIPDDLAGKEYLVLTGLLGSPTINQAGYWRREYIFITAINNNTVVSIDGVAVATLAARQVYSYQIDQASDLTYVTLSNPGLVNHVTGAGYGCEQGGAILPTVDKCTGSYNVTFSHSGPSGDDYALTIMARNDTVTGSPTKNQVASNFTLTVNGITYPIPASYFNYTHDSAFIYLKDDSQPADDGPDGVVYQYFFDRIPTGDPPTVARIENDLFKFHLGVLNGGSSNGAKYGFFSDYGSGRMSAGIGGAYATTQETYCTLDPIRLVASGGYNYYWTCTTDPKYNSRISDRNIADPFFYPDTNSLSFYDFNVEVKGECFDRVMPLKVTVAIGPISDFSLSEVEGCSPFTTTIINSTDPIFLNEMKWIFDPPNTVVYQETLPGMTFDRTFTNTTDTVQAFNITLYTALSASGMCLNTKTDTVYVYPAASKSQFEFTTTNTCDSLELDIDNQTVSKTENTYMWKFGDGTTSTEFEPHKKYAATELNDTTYEISLVTTSKWTCSDSSTKELHVPGKVSSEFTVSPEISCEPSVLTLDPSESKNTDSISWHIESNKIDSVFSSNPVEQTSFYIGQGFSDSIFISLTAFTDEFCSSISKDTIYVYKIPEADFSMSVKEGCPPLKVQFTNSSIGYGEKLSYVWKTNNIYCASTENTEIEFGNSSKQNQIIKVQLNVTSETGCSDSTSKELEVYGTVNADVIASETKGCGNIEMQYISGGSIGDSIFYFLNLPNKQETKRLSADTPFSFSYENNSENTDTITGIAVVVNSQLCSDTTVLPDLYIYKDVVADFKAEPDTGLSPLEVELENSSDNAESYYWDFQNGLTSDKKDLSVIFSSEQDSTFKVMLVASNKNCSDTVYKPIFVYIDEIISIQDNLVDSDLKMFINQSNQLEFNFSVLNNQHPFKYAVYDISGKLIVAEEKQYMQSGDYVEAIDLNGINPGVLIVQTQLNGKQRVQKLSYY